MPIEIRIKLSGLIGCSPSALRLCSTKLSTPPKLVACLKIFNLESPILPINNDVLESSIKLDLEHESYDLSFVSKR